jgi:hypothetical protein
MKHSQEEYYNPRPLPVTIASVFVLCITVWSGIRAWAAIVNCELLSRFRANPIYVFATGILWIIVGSALIFTLLKGSRIPYTLRVLRGHDVVPACGLVLSITYILWYWVDRLAIQIFPATNITFSIVVSIVGLVIFNANLFWPSSRAFFKEMP